MPPNPDRLGKIQKRIKRAFIANPDRELTTAELVEWAYPRQHTAEHWQRWNVKRAAAKVARLVRKGAGGRGHCSVFVAPGRPSAL